jgi:PKD repeat protein
MPEDTSTFTTKKHGLASGDEFKWGGGGASWEEEVNESNGFGKKNGNITIARPPIAAVSADVQTGNLDTTFSFDASETTDPTDTSLSYEWDLGNGETVTDSGGSITQTYGEVGEFAVTVTATNEYGNTDTASVIVTVESQSPEASFTVDQTTGDTDTAFSFNANGSTDPDGTALTYTWNFGDGTTATGKTTSHSFTDPGDYTVELTVEDAYGNTDTDSTAVSVESAAPETTGGEITQITIDGGTYRLHAFTADGTFSTDQEHDVEVLVVGGGGAGAYPGHTGHKSAGAGAGGVINHPSYSVSGTVSVNVGDGGNGPATEDDWNNAGGEQSTFGSLTALGGGYGGHNHYNDGLNGDGENGGSGGGGDAGGGSSYAGAGLQPNQNGDSGTYGYGNDGADSGDGGGGGAGETASSENGGDGIYVGDIFGTSYGVNGWFGGGGGAWGGGDGGAGGGGSGATDNSPPGDGINTTGGGGGSGHQAEGSPGGEGGSGIVLVRVGPL